MPPHKRTASSTASAPSTPRKRGRPATQTTSTPKSSLIAGNPASKRKASASGDGRNASSQERSQTGTITSWETTPTTHSSNKPAEDDSDDVPFTIECPAKALKKNSPKEDAYRGKDGAQFGLEVEYTVKPGRWGDMKRYGNIKYAGLDIQSGDFAYFAVSVEEPKAIPEEETLASDDPLKDERDNNYIGMITEARADDNSKVYVRVMYAYWPEELPQGRQSYHGMKEVVMSNHMNILNAHSIAGKVKVERIDDAVESVDGIYWRQTLDISKRPSGRGKEAGVLSKVKGHCRCRQPMNPDQTMYICRYCTLWNHDHCLIDDVLEKAWEKRLGGTLGQDDEEDTLKAEEDDSVIVIPQEKKKSPLMSNIKTMASTMASNMASGIFGGGGTPDPTTAPAIETAEAGSNLEEAQLDGPADVKERKISSRKAAPKGRNQARKPGDSAPWEGKLSVTIASTNKFGKAGLAVAQIVDEATGETVWATALSCFGCQRRFD